MLKSVFNMDDMFGNANIRVIYIENTYDDYEIG